MSIKSIAEKLSISKGTASLWCRDIPLTKEQQTKLHEHMIASGHKGRMLGALMNKKKREKALDNARTKAKQLIPQISQRDLLFLGLGLYWGEGSKKGQGRFTFVNSDPHTIKTIIHWLEKIMNLKRELLSPQVYINSQHKDRIVEVTNFWSKILKIPKKQFGNPVFIATQHKKIYANHNTYTGVLHLSIRKSAVLKYETMAMLERIQESV
jgi:hypothetical protein